MASTTCRKIVGLVLIAMIVGAEVRQVQEGMHANASLGLQSNFSNDPIATETSYGMRDRNIEARLAHRNLKQVKQTVEHGEAMKMAPNLRRQQKHPNLLGHAASVTENLDAITSDRRKHEHVIKRSNVFKEKRPACRQVEVTLVNLTLQDYMRCAHENKGKLVSGLGFQKHAQLIEALRAYRLAEVLGSMDLVIGKPRTNLISNAIGNRPFRRLGVAAIGLPGHPEMISSRISRPSAGANRDDIESGFNRSVLAETAVGVSLVGTTANIVKALLGSGMLTLPWAFYQSTFLPAVCFTLLIGLLAALNFFYLGLCSEITGLDSYTEIWTRCFGRRAGLVGDSVIALTSFMGMTTYLVVVGDYVPLGLKGLGCNLIQRRQYAILLVFALIFPLNFAKDLSILGHTSIIGSLGALYTAGMLSVEGIKGGVHSSDWELFKVQPGWFLMIAAIGFAFTGHGFAPQAYQELENRSPKRWAMATSLGFGISIMISLACGVSGYILFGSEVGNPGRSNVLTAQAFQGKPAAMLAYVATSFSVALAYPFESQLVRNSLDHGLMNLVPSCMTTSLARIPQKIRRHMLGALCTLASLGLALFTDNLGLLNAIDGAIGESLICFVFPSLMYLKCIAQVSLRKNLTRWLPWVSISSGVIAGIAGTVAALLAACNVNM